MRGTAVNIGLAFLTLLTCVVAGEIALRLFWENPHRLAEADKVATIRIQHPLVDLPVDRSAVDKTLPEGRFRTDDRSYILPSFQYEDPDFTVAFLGASTTECTAVSEEFRFHALVSKYLSREFRVNTLNAGRSGNTSHDSINALLNHVVLDRPDVVVMMHAANDASVITSQDRYRSRMGQYVTVAMLARWTAQMLSRFSLVGLMREAARSMEEPPTHKRTIEAADDKRNAAQSGAKEGLVVDAPHDLFRDRLKAFIGISRAMGMTPILMTQPASPSYRNALTPSWTNVSFQEAFNQIVREVGTDQGVAVIDLVEYLNANVEGWDQPDVVFYDALHVNNQGSELYARHISERLTPILRDLMAQHDEQGRGEL